MISKYFPIIANASHKWHTKIISNICVINFLNEIRNILRSRFALDFAAAYYRIFLLLLLRSLGKHVRIRSYSGPHFPAFGLTLRIQSKCGKMRTWITPNMNTLHVVVLIQIINVSKSGYTLTQSKSLSLTYYHNFGNVVAVAIF